MNKSEEYWSGEDAQAVVSGLRELRTEFPENSIGTFMRGGVQIRYVGHADVTDRLLTVDPFWTWEPLAVTPEGLPLVKNGCLWIRLTVCGVTRLGVGDCSKSEKELIGDAIRNAAMRFGVALDMWTKDSLESASIAGRFASRASWAEDNGANEQTFTALKELAEKAGWSAERLAAGVKWASAGRTSDVSELSEIEARRLLGEARRQAANTNEGEKYE